MNGYDITYCINEKCNKKECRRHYTKIPPNDAYTEKSKFTEKNCKYYMEGEKNEKV